MDTTPQKICKYCGCPVPPRKDRPDSDYCNDECYRAMNDIPKPMYVAREIPFNAELHGETISADHVRFHDEQVQAAREMIVGLTPDQIDRFTQFFADWLAMSQATRDGLALRLAGLTCRDAGAVLGVTTQAVSKNMIQARKRHAIVDKLLPDTRPPHAEGTGKHFPKTTSGGRRARIYQSDDSLSENHVDHNAHETAPDAPRFDDDTQEAI